MVSADSQRDGPATRRRVLAGFGAAVTAGLAGCSGRLPGTGPERLDAESTVETDTTTRILWEYPPREGERDGIGYAEVEVDRIRRRNGDPRAIRLTFNSTVGGPAAGEPYTGYRPDWFRFRIWPSTSRISYRTFVEPPGQWEKFSAYYDRQAGIRRTVVELRDVGTRGTIQIPAHLSLDGDPLPDGLHCSFTARVSRPGLLGEAVRVSGRDTLPLGES